MIEDKWSKKDKQDFMRCVVSRLHLHAEMQANENARAVFRSMANDLREQFLPKKKNPFAKPRKRRVVRKGFTVNLARAAKKAAAKSAAKS